MSDNPKSIQLSADELQLMFVQACELQDKAHLQEALSIYRELLQFIPQSSMIHYNMGLAYFDLEDFKIAAAHYNTASQESPTDPDIQIGRASCRERV